MIFCRLLVNMPNVRAAAATSVDFNGKRNPVSHRGVTRAVALRNHFSFKTTEELVFKQPVLYLV